MFGVGWGQNEGGKFQEYCGQGQVDFPQWTPRITAAQQTQSHHAMREEFQSSNMSLGIN